MSQLQSVLTFDGIDDYIEVPYSEKLNRKIFTLSCWVRPAQLRGTDNVIVSSNRDGASQGYLLSCRTQDWYFFMQKHLFYSSAPITNIWSHLTATFDDSTSKLYFNGQAVGEVTVQYANINPSVPLRIGTGTNPAVNILDFFFTGQIAEVCIWNKVRTQQEIQSDMNKRLSGTEEGLVGYWPLNEGSGITAIDKTGNGHNGIIRGGAWSQQEIPLEPVKPTTEEPQTPTTSSTGGEVTNTPSKDSSAKDTKIAAGSTTPGATNWQVYEADGETAICVDVDTSAAGFTKTPVYVISIAGARFHAKTTGGDAVYDPTAKGFRVYIKWARFSTPPEELTPAIANAEKWHINWIGVES